MPLFTNSLSIFIEQERFRKAADRYERGCLDRRRASEVRALFEANTPRGHNDRRCGCRICRAHRGEYPLD